MKGTFVVDRVERDTAVLIGDDGTTVRVPKARLRNGAVEGAVFQVPFTGRDPNWEELTRDLEEEARRRDLAQRRLDALRARDPGGDVVL